MTEMTRDEMREAGIAAVPPGEPGSGAITLCAAHSVRSGPRSPADLEEWKACPDCVRTPWKVPADGS